MKSPFLFPAALLAALATIVLSNAAKADDSNAAETKAAPSLASSYRGAFVCEKLAGAADILHVPVDFAVRGTEVQFARPLFNARGARVVGSELGTGTVDAGGNIRLASSWFVHGIEVRGDYAGTLSPASGVLTGKQTWRDPEGAVGSRVCQIAVVPAANATHTAKN